MNQSNTEQVFDEVIKPQIDKLMALAEQHGIALTVFGTYDLNRKCEEDGFFETYSGGFSSVLARHHSSERLVIQSLLIAVDSDGKFSNIGLSREKWESALHLALTTANAVIQDETHVTH